MKSASQRPAGSLPGDPPSATGDPSAPVAEVLDHLFRHEFGRMVALLTRIFGTENLQLAEDVVQEALARALQTWPFYGVPRNPAAWILRASRNLAVDFVRRQRNFRDKQTQIIQLMELSEPERSDARVTDTTIPDDRLQLMFVCCHPRIPADSQVALALRTLCGFSPQEIASGLLSTEAAVAKRLTRAKQKIREARIKFEVPQGEELEARLEGVLQCLYLLFNEGYKASKGEALVRTDLCHEAIRLVRLLAAHSLGDRPKVHALLGLMLLNAARFSTRVSGEGNLLRLSAQDRSRWDRGMIAEGMFHLHLSATGSEVSVYHLQAAIAACHCAAPTYESTDWPRILSLYDQLLILDNSPVVALNRAVVVAHLEGPAAGLQALAIIADAQELRDYHLFHAALGEFRFQLNQPGLAARHFRTSLDLATVACERAFLAERLQACNPATPTAK